MNMPKFLAIAAITLDGKIAKHARHMSSWTSKEDKAFMRGLLDKCDAVVVGNNTYKTAIRPLSKRNCIVISRSVNSNFAKASSDKQLISKSARLMYCQPDKKQFQKIIRENGYKLIAILGGAQTYSFCLKNNFFDELYLTIEPLTFGSGINLFANNEDDRHSLGENDGHPRLDCSGLEKHFLLLSVKKLNPRGTTLLHYKRYKPPLS